VTCSNPKALGIFGCNFWRPCRAPFSVARSTFLFFAHSSWLPAAAISARRRPIASSKTRNWDSWMESRLVWLFVASHSVIAPTPATATLLAPARLVLLGGLRPTRAGTIRTQRNPLLTARRDQPQRSRGPSCLRLLANDIEFHSHGWVVQPSVGQFEPLSVSQFKFDPQPSRKPAGFR
jgi:hypothetical protein